MRKAIEDVNSGHLKPKEPEDEEFCKSPLQEPLLFSDKKVNSTVSSMDSALSNSANCSEIELDSIDEQKSSKK